MTVEAKDGAGSGVPTEGAGPALPRDPILEAAIAWTYSPAQMEDRWRMADQEVIDFALTSFIGPLDPVPPVIKRLRALMMAQRADNFDGEKLDYWKLGFDPIAVTLTREEWDELGQWQRTREAIGRGIPSPTPATSVPAVPSQSKRG
jgi:hypothetical protein